MKIAAIGVFTDRLTEWQTDASDFIICPIKWYNNGTDNNRSAIKKSGGSIHGWLYYLSAYCCCRWMLIQIHCHAFCLSVCRCFIDIKNVKKWDPDDGDGAATSSWWRERSTFVVRCVCSADFESAPDWLRFPERPIWRRRLVSVSADWSRRPKRRSRQTVNQTFARHCKQWRHSGSNNNVNPYF